MTYEKNKIIALLYRIFQSEDYRYSNELFSPSYNDIEKLVNTLERDAYEVNGIAETGRIRVEYDSESRTYTYYLYLGIESS